jgi:DNA repair photolyase
MSYIYIPKGKALEYGELALNLYNGCSHKCRYCYAPSACQKKLEEFHNPRPRVIDYRLLQREIDKLSGHSVFMCFTCDPYLHLETELNITRNMIQRLHDAGIKAVILTKAGSRSAKDFDLLSLRPELSQYGATLTFLNDKDSLEWEPGAALPADRIATLKKAHDLGISTWASLEPVIDPVQSLEIIRQTHEFIDLFKVGRWNHDKRADLIDWKGFGTKAVDLLETFKKPYYIKADLKKYL